jgi:hypothetical protein
MVLANVRAGEISNSSEREIEKCRNQPKLEINAASDQKEIISIN